MHVVRGEKLHNLKDFIFLLLFLVMAQSNVVKAQETSILSNQGSDYENGTQDNFSNDSQKPVGQISNLKNKSKDLKKIEARTTVNAEESGGSAAESGRDSNPNLVGSSKSILMIDSSLNENPDATQSAGSRSNLNSNSDKNADSNQSITTAPLKVLPESKQRTVKAQFKTSANREYNKPTYFSPADNAKLPAIELDYELSDEGRKFRLGSVVIDENSFKIALLPLGESHPSMGKLVNESQFLTPTLFLTWPEDLIPSGTLVMISKKGDVLWRNEIRPDQIIEWKQRRSIWKKSLKASGINNQDLQKDIFSASYGLQGLENNGFNRGLREKVRFCIQMTEDKFSSKICSQYYSINSVKGGYKLSKTISDSISARVFIGNEVAPLANVVKVSTTEPTSLFTELSTGQSYEFYAQVRPFDLADISDSEDSDYFKIISYDTKPLGPSVLVNSNKDSNLIKMLGFQSTIGDNRKLWLTQVSTAQSKVFLPGLGGGVFTQRIATQSLPISQSRIYLNVLTPEGTYIDGITLEGRKLPSSEVSSTQNSVILDEKNPNHFYWNFQALIRGEMNRSYLDLKYQGKEFKAYHEIYKGYPREFSLRLSAVAAAENLTFLGEVAFSQWFEQVLYSTNYYLSRQRWGFSGKYFNAFNKLKIDSSGTLGEYNALNLDFRYRFTPGLWNRDETFGAIASFQDITFGLLTAPMAGAGGFWARSMPKVFDNFFNLLPIMRYPKWVDMEFIYYAVPLAPEVSLNASMSLNFHGKVLWTNTIYGEAGFGYKRYAFADTSKNKKAELNTFYGTIGLGIDF